MVPKTFAGSGKRHRTVSEPCAAQVTHYKGLPAGREYVPHSHLAALETGEMDPLFNATVLRHIHDGLDFRLESQLGHHYTTVFGQTSF